MFWDFFLHFFDLTRHPRPDGGTRARTRIYINSPKKNPYTPITYTYTLHLLGFEGVILVRARDTPWGMTKHGVSRVPNFVWFSLNLKFCSQFHHRICCP